MGHCFELSFRSPPGLLARLPRPLFSPQEQVRNLLLALPRAKANYPNGPF